MKKLLMYSDVTLKVEDYINHKVEEKTFNVKFKPITEKRALALEDKSLTDALQKANDIMNGTSNATPEEMEKITEEINIKKDNMLEVFYREQVFGKDYDALLHFATENENLGDVLTLLREEHEENKKK